MRERLALLDGVPPHPSFGMSGGISCWNTPENGRPRQLVADIAGHRLKGEESPVLATLSSTSSPNLPPPSVAAAPCTLRPRRWWAVNDPVAARSLPREPSSLVSL